jgi:hypothetical protein
MLSTRALATGWLVLALCGCPSDSGDDGGIAALRSGVSLVGSVVRSSAAELQAEVIRENTINGHGLGSKTAPLYDAAAAASPWTGYPDGLPQARLDVYAQIRADTLPVYRAHEDLLASLEGSTSQRRDWDALLDAWTALELAFAQALVERGMSYAEARHLTVRIDDQYCAAAHADHPRPDLPVFEGPLATHTRERIAPRDAELEALEQPVMDRILFALGLGRRRVLRVLAHPLALAAGPPAGLLASLKDTLESASEAGRLKATIRGAPLSDTAPLLKRAREENPPPKRGDEIGDERVQVFLAIQTQTRARLEALRPLLALTEQEAFVYDEDRLLVLRAWAELKLTHARALVELGMSAEEYLRLAESGDARIRGEADPLLHRVLFCLAPFGSRIQEKGAHDPYPVPSADWDD